MKINFDKMYFAALFSLSFFTFAGHVSGIIVV